MADTNYDDSGSDGEGGKKQRRSTAGRKLMRWNPDIDQYVLLAVDIACTEQGRPVPWESVAEKINDWVTGEGIKQHLAKVRKYREESGRLNPQKRGSRKASMRDFTETPQCTPKKNSRGNSGVKPLTGKGASLLWDNPRQKRTKDLAPPTQQQEPTEPEKNTKQPGETQGQKAQKEQKSKGGRKEAEHDEAQLATPKTPAEKSCHSAIKEDDNNERISNKKKSTGKRSRPRKEPAIKEEDEGEYYSNDSPTKKQRTLRATYHVNYDETQMADDFDEDIFDARSQGGRDDDDGDYDEGLCGSQPNTGLNSENVSSHSSQMSTNTPVQAPPNFDNMLHSRTGMHSHGEAYMHGGHGSNFGMFTGLNNSYGLTGYGGDQGMGKNGVDMMMDHGSQYNDPSHFTDDQLQMYAQHAGYGSYGGDQQAHGSRGNATPARKARKQMTRDDDGEGTAPPLSKKDRKKNRDYAKQAKKDKASRKNRKDSVHDYDVSGEQQTGNFFTDENFGNIPIANDTGRGFDQTFGQNMPNITYPMTTFEQQQAPTLTASPTDIGFDFKGGLPLPSTMPNFQNNSTGITPHFNNFSFGDTNNFGSHGADFPMQTTEFDGFEDYTHFGGNVNDNGMATLNSSFSSSNDTSTAGSQGDQTLPSMQFSADDGAGLRLANTWMPDTTGTGMGMGMGDDGQGEQDHDMFSFVNHESFH